MFLSKPVPAGPTPASHRAESPAAHVSYGFAGVEIGASLADLHDVRPKASCAPPKAGVVDCVAPDQPVGGGYFARNLNYRFIGGRLAQIRFRSSIDGFAFVVAKLKHDFGAPDKVRRDVVRLYDHDFDHVAFTWRNGRSTIQLSDPVTATQMEVKITFDSVKSRLDAGPA